MGSGAWRREWARLPATAQDGVLAAGLLVLSLVLLVAEPESAVNGVTRRADALGALLVVVATLPLALRRRAPLLVLLPVAAGGATAVGLGYAAALTLLWLALAVESAVVHARRPVALPLGLLCVATAVGLVVAAGEGRSPLNVLGAAMVAALPATGGYALRTSRTLAAEQVERAERVTALRTSELQRAVAEERTQIARDVHDVVGHHLSAIHLQAGAGRRTGGVERFAVIEQLSSQALEETRRTLGLLRGDAPEVPLAGVDDLEPLLATARRSGVEVSLEVTGAPRPLPAAVSTGAYRVVQEALTNVAKHARPSRARVAMTYGPADVQVVVEDDGRPAGAPGEGHGLVGMRERAAFLGGTLEAGPEPRGGWRVRAVLPT